MIHRARAGTDSDAGLTVILCSATEPFSGRPCDRPRGHAGPHVSITEGSTLAWGAALDTAQATR